MLDGTRLLLFLGVLFDSTAAGAVLLHQPHTTESPGPTPSLATTTVPHRVLNVVSWPLPTAASLRRRSNTVCGYIGGNPQQPATCSAGSHCVLDAQHSVVGCCPDGAATACTAGVFTACDDTGGGGVINPYVYTCPAGRVCYKNDFGGGYYQYGCGTARTQGQTVATAAVSAASGRLSVALSSERVTFTGVFAGTSVSSSISSTKSTPTSPTSSTSPTSTATPDTITNQSRSRNNQAGIIAGATLGALAGVVALVAVVVCCLQKRQRTRRDAVLAGQTYTKPADSHNTSGQFEALHSSPDHHYETGLHEPEPDVFRAAPDDGPGDGLAQHPVAVDAPPSECAPLAHTYEHAHEHAYEHIYDDDVYYHQANVLSRIGEEDEGDDEGDSLGNGDISAFSSEHAGADQDVESTGVYSTMLSAAPPPRSMRPLWQQHR